MKLLIISLSIALALVGCINNSDQQQVNYSTVPLDTIKTSPVHLNAKPDLFERAFIRGTTAKAMESTLNLFGATIGKIKITSGKVVACDPILIEEYGNPFTQIFPTGEFPVQLSIATLGDAATTAFARISFSDEPVVRWEFALLQGQKQATLGSKTDHGYVVDGGLGSFMDFDARNTLLKEKSESFQGEIYKAVNEHHYKNWKYTMYNTGKNNLAAFTSGFGDGHYTTYIGYDAQGKPCRLLTDFEIFDWAATK